MNRQPSVPVPTDPNARFDAAIEATRAASLDDATVAAAGERVWARLTAAAHEATPGADAPTTSVAPPSGPITGCAGYQSLIPAFLAGTLPASRKTLLEAHTRECVPCRRALKAARDGQTASTPAAAGSTRGPLSGVWRTALAAGLATVVGIGGWLAFDRLVPTGGEVTVVAVEGDLWALDGASGRARSVALGATVEHGTMLRTSGGSRAVVRLEDGSLVEISERAALAVGEKRRETVIDLDRGVVIVQAAKQHGKQLYVATDDCQVAVVGTIFAVNHGTKGSRVSVIEGEVRVAQGRRSDTLRPGDQVTTTSRLARVPLAQEIAWSRDRESYLQLLAELVSLEEEIRAEVEGPSRRFDTGLLDAAPASTAVWVGIPNLSASLADAYAVFGRKLQSSPILADWWQRAGGAEIAPELEETIARLRDFGSFLGPEVAVAVLRGGQELAAPVALAMVVGNPAAFSAHLDAEIDRLTAEVAGQGLTTAPIRRIADPLALAPALPAVEDEALLVWVTNDRLVASPSLWALQEVARGGGFAGTPFHARLAAAYQEGVEWVVAADLAGLVGQAADEASREHLARSGFDAARHLVLESEAVGARTATQASFSFDGPRHGIPSWLAAPAPMGALEFVSPDATLAIGMLTKEPAAMADDLFALIGGDAEALAKLEAFEREGGISVRDDLAAPLGGEMVFALDGPVLPKPAWKLVLEVNDPAGFDQAVAWAVEQLDAAMVREGKGNATINSIASGGQTVYTIGIDVHGEAGTTRLTEVSYTQVAGYAIVTPQRQLLDQAIAARTSGMNLPASGRFQSLLPQDGEANLSGVVYANLEPLVSAAGSLVSGTSLLTAEQQALLGQLGSGPALGWAYASDDAITLAASTEGGLFGLDFGSLLSLGAALGFGAVNPALDAGEAASEADEAVTTTSGPGAPQQPTGWVAQVAETATPARA
jgi:hypothetical protein